MGVGLTDHVMLFVVYSLADVTGAVEQEDPNKHGAPRSLLQRI